MDYAKAFVEANKQHRLADLVPLNENLYRLFKVDECSYKEWENEVQKLGYDLNKFYVDAKSQSFSDRFFYVGEYATVSYPVIDLKWLAFQLNKDQLRRNQVFKEMFEAGEYTVYFFPENNSFAIDYFIQHFDKIPEYERYGVFKDLYLYLETSFVLFPSALIERILESAPKRDAQQQLVKGGKVKDGKVTVYRGMMESSTALKDALSWTLSFEKAKMFATRDHKKGVIYRGLIDLDQIIDYLPDREEEEDWLRYKSIDKIKKLKV